MRVFRISLALTLLIVAGLQASPKLVWQPGQIASMKEEGADRDGKWTSYVYGVQGKDRLYTVVVSTPLKANVHDNVKFSVDKSVVYIQDAGGKVRKSCVLEPASAVDTAKRD